MYRADQAVCCLTINLFQVGTLKGSGTPKGKKKKKYSPLSPRSVKTARTTQAIKRATVVRKAWPAAEMASASVDEDVARSPGEEGGNDRSNVATTEVTWNQIRRSTQPEMGPGLCLQQAPLQTCLKVTTDLEVSSRSIPKMRAAADLMPRIMQDAAASQTGPPGGGGDDRSQQNDRQT
jgi:hypothetical protein